MAQVLRDSYGRTLDYLRISLTEACNFRCAYCVPSGGVKLANPEDLLTTEELVRLVGIFAGLEVKRVRLTGGEPLFRQDLLPLVRTLSSIPGLSGIALTTNGSLLAPLAQSLQEAGLTTVNVSLDSLDRDRFRRITGRDRLDDVLAGVSAAMDARLRVKLNVMALSDLSREEVLSFCCLAVEHPVSVRFLEVMPLCGEGWSASRMRLIAEIKRWVSEDFELHPLPRGHHAAETFEVPGARGSIGFIASLSEPFCERCNRLRLTASGELSLCLFSPARVDLRSGLRGGRSDAEITETIRTAVREKPRERGSLGASRDLPRIRVIGG